MYATPPVRHCTVRHCRLAAGLAIALAPGSTSRRCVREVEMGSPAVVMRFVGHFWLAPLSSLATTPCLHLAGNDGLTAFAHLDVLDDDGLLTSRSQPL